MMNDYVETRRTSDDSILKGATLYPREYKKIHSNYRRRCSFCFQKFIEEFIYGLPWKGYATADDEHWVCTRCYEKWGDELRIKIASEPTPKLKTRRKAAKPAASSKTPSRSNKRVRRSTAQRQLG